MTDEKPADPSTINPAPQPVLPPPTPTPAELFTPMPEGGGLGTLLSSLLQHPRRVVFTLHQPRGGAVAAALMLIAILCLALFGLVVGSFSGGTQLWASPLKITAGALVAAIICLPSLYVFTCLGGAGEHLRLGGLWGLMAGLLALEGLLLISFAPVAWIFSASTESVAFVSALYLFFWIIAIYFGVRFLRSGATYLGIADRGYLRIWIIIFLLVNLQMMTALRPIVGTAPDLLPTEKKFFLVHWSETLGGEIMAQFNRVTKGNDEERR